MRQGESIFLLTLVDFLLQIIFFGIFLYVIVTASTVTQGEKKDPVKEILAYFGVSNLDELTDDLTRLAPIKDIREAVKVVKDAGGADKARDAVNLVKNAGGAKEVEGKFTRLAKYEEGFGKPPCHFSLGPNNKKIPKSIATVVATDDRISFQSNTPELSEVLQKLGLSYDAIKTLSLQEFDRTFTPIKQKQTSCFYWLVFNEKTRFVEARDAARKSFQLFYRREN